MNYQLSKFDKDLITNIHLTCYEMYLHIKRSTYIRFVTMIKISETIYVICREVRVQGRLK